MERAAWTDGRLDDRFDQIDRRFDQVDRRLDRIETEMREGFSGVRADIAQLQTTMTRSYVALAIALIAAIAVRGI